MRRVSANFDHIMELVVFDSSLRTISYSVQLRETSSPFSNPLRSVLSRVRICYCDTVVEPRFYIIRLELPIHEMGAGVQIKIGSHG